MKTTKINLKALILAIFAAFMVFFSACSEDNIIGTSSNSENPSNMPLDTGISIQVGKQVGTNFYLVTVVNNSRDTINDFHAQMVDGTMRFISPNTMNSGWHKSYGGQNHTDSSKVDLVTNRGLGYQPIKPGQQKQVLGFYVGWGRGNTSKKLNFNWQATKDGVVIRSGTYTE